MKRGIVFLIFGIGITVFFSSCPNKPDYPVEPVIAYKSMIKNSLAGVDTSIYLTISFTDGDGDIGLRDGTVQVPYDTCSIYQFNYYLRFMKKVNGSFVTYLFPPPPHPNCTGDAWATIDSFLAQRVPYLEPHGNNKSLEGEIKYTILLKDIYQGTNDTLKFQVFIYDRRLHKSNVVETPEVIVNVP